VATIAEAIATAIGHQEAGRLHEAETIYRQILALDPGNIAAWHLLGRVAQQGGQFPTAIECMERAIACGANYGEVYNDLAPCFVAKAGWPTQLPPFAGRLS